MAYHTEQFVDRHISPSKKATQQMLDTIGVTSIDTLIDQTVPSSIRLENDLDLPLEVTEVKFLEQFKALATLNKNFRTYIGMGYYNCTLPTVIQRNILENPGWYTAYTPYQAEIAQGRLEALLNFQTLITDLTGMEIANASLLDEGTAAAEAMTMLYRVRERSKKKATIFFVDQYTFPQTISIIKGRAQYIGIEVVVGDIATLDFSNPDLFGVFIQYPNSEGAILDPSAIGQKAVDNKVKVAVAADLMAMTLLKSPGEMGADVVVGTSQRFGIPLGYGGPHAGFFATREAYKRQIPGRIIGVSKDAKGNTAFRMSLQTREQHIKRDRATSNICTAQVLLSVMAGMYAVYHGKEGLLQISNRIHTYATTLASSLEVLGYTITHNAFFDTLKVETTQVSKIKEAALEQSINFRYFEESAVGISVDETTTKQDILDILALFATPKMVPIVEFLEEVTESQIPQDLQRSSDFLTHPNFKNYHTEHEMLRYIKRLESKDLSLVHSMISLGSCTMKLNASTEMMPLSWEGWSNIHPFVPVNQAEGYQKLFTDLSQWLSEITGFHQTSLQPNSGAQGELAGLLVIKAMFESKGEGHRNITLIPSSAHGTNPASAIMVGQKVVIVKCLENGDIDLEDLKEKAILHKDNLMALMVTYPSTHGVFEEGIKEACAIVHQNGGRVYMDGANLNAQLGLTSPGFIGADVCHLNLHKTFCIPHGGGGPGMGPIAVTKELTPFLPSHPVIDCTQSTSSIEPISAAPWGSASILTISYAYIAMMGAKGLKKATEVAILNANYMQARLEAHYPVLFKGSNGRNAHELIVDCRGFIKFGITVTDIAKRLMDYGFHAPTVSFPVVGTLMIEPTESETKEEIDRFCDALIQIRKEVQEVIDGVVDPEQNVLKNAPHTQDVVTSDDWKYPYTRKQAAFPLPYVKERKFWASVSRIDDAYGDRNLICSCPDVSSYEEEQSVCEKEIV